MVMIALLLFGLLAYTRLPLELMPDAKIPYVTVNTIYAGASAEQIQDLVTRKIEDEVSSISLLSSITSYSLNSASVIVLEFDLDKDSDIAYQETKEKIDAVAASLPPDAMEPVVSKVDIAATPVMNLLLGGDLEATELNHLARTTVKDRISQIEGVGTVNILGGVEKEIRVDFDAVDVYEQAISLSQVAGLLAYGNMDMPGGNFQEGGADYPVGVRGQFTDIGELEELLIPTSTGMRALGDLSRIASSPEDVRERITLFDTETGVRQENSVLLSIVKSPQGNPVQISDAVKAVMKELENTLPEGATLAVTLDTSEEIRNTVSDTLSNILLGILLTSAILLFFLHDIRSTLIVALSMPLSIIPTFILMNLLGISLNLMSLMGLSVSVGVLVMNSVVVLENVFRHKSLGHGRKEAARKGTSEVAVAVFASTLTNVAVFLPLGTMGGMAGVFVGDFALTIVIATMFSLLISFTLTPMLASLLLPEHAKEKNAVSRGIEAMFRSIERGYSFLLEKILHNRVRSTLLILGTVALFVFTLVKFTSIPTEFIPTVDNSVISVEIELPVDASLDRTAEVVKQVEDRIASFDEVDQIVTTLGSISALESGVNLASLNVQLSDKEGRETHSIIASRIHESLSDIPGAVFRVQATTNLSASTMPILFYLQSQDMDELSESTREMVEAMNRIEGVTGVDTTMKAGKPEITVTPDRQTVSQMGITLQQFALSVRASIDGLVLTQLKEGGREYDIRVSLSDEGLLTYDGITNIPIVTPRGTYPLSFFAEVDVNEGANSLLRIDKKHTVEVSASIIPGYILGPVSTSIDDAASEVLSPQVTLEWGGNSSIMTETVNNMIFAFVIAVILTYMLLAALLEKIGQPLLILSTIPLSLIGVVALFLLTGYTMSMVSMIAIIMLVGMVVNNAILILEYTNQLRAGGMDVRSALLKACPTKLQPVLMANIATILGMLPMAIGLGSSGVEFRQPMAMVTIGGILASTFLTLFVIPAIENTIESGKEKKKKTEKGEVLS